jgi:hypothetical protein
LSATLSRGAATRPLYTLCLHNRPWCEKTEHTEQAELTLCTDIVVVVSTSETMVIQEHDGEPRYGIATTEICARTDSGGRCESEMSA